MLIDFGILARLVLIYTHLVREADVVEQGNHPSTTDGYRGMRKVYVSTISIKACLATNI